jgi:hypothetical protein
MTSALSTTALTHSKKKMPVQIEKCKENLKGMVLDILMLSPEWKIPA